jgi:hypothetical protein
MRNLMKEMGVKNSPSIDSDKRVIGTMGQPFGNSKDIPSPIKPKQQENNFI